jgi:hypothetical protein
VLATLVHEVVHAVDRNENGHGAPFKKIATKVGLVGKMTATTAGEELEQKIEGWVKKLGDYPHAKLSAMTRVEADHAHDQVRVRRLRLHRALHEEVDRRHGRAAVPVQQQPDGGEVMKKSRCCTGRTRWPLAAPFATAAASTSPRCIVSGLTQRLRVESR